MATLASLGNLLIMSFSNSTSKSLNGTQQCFVGTTDIKALRTEAGGNFRLLLQMKGDNCTNRWFIDHLLVIQIFQPLLQASSQTQEVTLSHLWMRK